MPKPLAGYIRVSRSSEALKSPEFQQHNIQRAADSRKTKVVFFPPDIDKSGAKRSRTTLDNIINKIKSGELGGIFVDKLDRLSRLSPKERVLLFEEIEDNNGVVLSASENLDVRTPEGRFARDVFLGVARLEWERYRDGWQTSQASAIKNGHAISHVPFGYVRKDKGLAVDPVLGPVARTIFEMRVNGAGRGKIAEYLKSNNIKTANDNANWSPRGVAHIIQNRVYLGELIYGQNVNPHAHEPIVDVGLWTAANQINRSLTPVRAKKPFLLSGLLRCAHCRYCMVGKTRGVSRYYVCSQQDCPNRWKSYHAKTVERLVTNPVHALNPEAFFADHTPEIDTADLQLEYNKAQALLDQVESPEAQAAFGERYLTIVTERREAAEVALVKLTDAQRANQPEEPLNPGWTTAEFREALGRVIDCVSVSLERELVIYPKNYGPKELPRRGTQRKTRKPFSKPPTNARAIRF